MADWKIHSSRNPHRHRVSIDTGTETLVQQAYKDECDIHVILKQYEATGFIDHLNSRPGAYLELPSDLELQASIDVINQANGAFADLPARVRDRFKNSPQEFLAALQNPELKNELIDLGVFIKPLNQTPPPSPSPQEPSGAALLLPGYYPSSPQTKTYPNLS